MASPVIGNRKGNLKLGQELEVLLLSLLREARPHQQHPEVLCSDHPILRHRPGALDVEDPLQAFGQPDGVQEVEVPQAVARVWEVQQGSCFYEEADGCRQGGRKLDQNHTGTRRDSVMTLFPGRNQYFWHSRLIRQGGQLEPGDTLCCLPVS